MTELSLSGTVSRELALLFVEQLSRLGRADSPVVIDLEEAELEDANAVAVLTSGIRSLAQEVGPVELWGAPQLLAHALYRVGALSKHSIRLIHHREEIGSAP